MVYSQEQEFSPNTDVLTIYVSQWPYYQREKMMFIYFWTKIPLLSVDMPKMRVYCTLSEGHRVWVFFALSKLLTRGMDTRYPDQGMVTWCFRHYDGS